MPDGLKPRRNVRLEDLAEKAGVSISTVSRALNDSPAVNRRTKQLIWKLAKELDYPFRGYMPAGPIGAEATIAVVVPQTHARETHLFNPFLFELLASAGEAARARECDLLISHVAPKTLEDLAYTLEANRAKGVLFIGQSSLHSQFNELVDHGSNFVVWGAELPDQRYCSIGSDNLLGGRRATSHLMRLGRKRILFLGDQAAPETLMRYRGFVEAHNATGRSQDPNLVIDANLDLHSAYEHVASLIHRGVAFDGIVAASDLIAFGAMKALRRAGRSVPDDVSVVGYDNIPMARLSDPALTTISQDTEVAGRMLVSKLLDGTTDHLTSERTPTNLIIRETCGA